MSESSTPSPSGFEASVLGRLLLLLALVAVGVVAYRHWNEVKSATFPRSGASSDSSSASMPDPLPAARGGDVEALVRYFNGPSPQPDLRDAEGRSLLELAVLAGSPGAVAILIERGARIDGEAGTQALRRAVVQHDAVLVRQLAAAGVDVTSSAGTGEAAILPAVREQDPVVVRELLEAGADPEERDSTGLTPLMLALQQDDPVLVRELLDGGASRETTAPGGRTAEDFVVPSGRVVQVGLIRPADRGREPSAPSESASADPEDRLRLTRLRPLRAPMGVWKHSGRGVMLDRASVDVRNMGDVEAEDIQVMLVLPGGSQVQMSGPESLPRYGTATYSVTEPQTVTRYGRLRV
ncbi:MAG: ankyrin repeat domain-containing protein, partial [Bdellovibrionales bacterium]|nr:ankyrin repeat domain-containing protein [Bdellovibrionales bacterium]